MCAVCAVVRNSIRTLSTNWTKLTRGVSCIVSSLPTPSAPAVTVTGRQQPNWTMHVLVLALGPVHRVLPTTLISLCRTPRLIGLGRSLWHAGQTPGGILMLRKQRDLSSHVSCSLSSFLWLTQALTPRPWALRLFVVPVRWRSARHR